ncbi:MAG: FkbM family methyltransferase [Planctomycetia bacterium]|nr:FkbM family methyltransferase [Planctomycetia bacterium]
MGIQPDVKVNDGWRFKMAEKSLKDFVDVAKKFIGESNIKIIIEIGARDCAETLAFNRLLKNSTIYTFECNPATLPICRTRVKNYNSIHLIEKAITNLDGKIKFFQIDQKRTKTTWEDGNPGASSLLKVSGKYQIEDYVQNEIEVEAITLNNFIKTYNIKVIDLLWMDIQGAELLALQGLKENIHNIKFIHLEVEFFGIYQDQPLFKDIKTFLNRHGFLLLKFTSFGKYAADAVFVNKKVIPVKRFVVLWLSDRLAYFINKINYIIKNILIRVIKKFIHLKKMDVRNRASLFFIKRIKPAKFNKIIPQSSIKIDIIIPAHEKDADVLPYVIDAVRKNVNHPIGNIIIISYNSDKILTICTAKQCIFVNENTVLPITKNDIKHIVNGSDRTGWLFQQLLKLGGERLSSQEHYLILDADTIFIRPHVFEFQGKTIFYCSDEYHKPYFTMYERLLGIKAKCPLSFVSHTMLIEKTKLENLRKEIENKHKTTWYEAIINNIDKSEGSGFSEYETYGNYVFSHYSKEIILEYWFNLSLAKGEIKNIENLKKQFLNKYKSISFHSYNKE